jgi:hypothetical protein
LYGYGLTEIALAFIAVALLAVMVDQITRVLQAIMKKIPFLPDEFELPIAYIILVSIASAVCWQGHFDLFKLLGFDWVYHKELGWILTGCIISGGSSLLGKQFKMVNLIPGIISGGASMFGYGSSTDTDTTTDTTTQAMESSQEGPL